MPDTLHVKMLGGFSLSRGGRSLDDHSNRMRKVWLLLAYLIYSRNSHVTQDHYLSLFQGAGGDEGADPGGRLKAMFYRARAMLDQLEDGAGHELIIRKGGTYAWNTEVPLTLDTEEFEKLCRAAAEGEPAERLELYSRALKLYRGDFLPKLSMEPWVMPISAYYHRLYLDAAEQSLTLLEEGEQWARAVSLCQRALQVEPYSEELYRRLMRARVALGDRAGALAAYEEMSELLFSTFGVMPSEESRLLYREAAREAESRTISAGAVRDMLREPDGARGALYCEYDFFKMLYQVQARAVIRSGDTIHLALFTLRGRSRKELPRRSLDRAMDNLRELLIASLRQGDVVTRCSVSQLIVMLPQANYENSCAVCRRVLRAFSRQYPHSPAQVQFSVQPLEPMLPPEQKS